MHRMCLLVLILLVTQPALADWPKTGNAKLDELLTKAKGAPHKEAFKMYEEALKIKPDCADIFAERAIHYDESGQFNKAIEDCEKALKLNPEDAVTYETKARAYLQLGKYEEALKAAQKAAAIGNRHDELDHDELRVWGAALYHLGKYKEAVLPLTSGLNYVRSKNESADAHYYRGLCYEKMKHYTEALNDLNAAIKIAPKRPQYYEARSRMLKATGKTKLALSDAKQAQVLPRDSHVLFY